MNHIFLRINNVQFIILQVQLERYKVLESLSSPFFVMHGKLVLFPEKIEVCVWDGVAHSGAVFV